MPDLSATEYPTFFQNLSQRVQAKEVSSLHVLGEDFFSLVDTFSQQLFDEYQRDLLLLEMEPESFQVPSLEVADLFDIHQKVVD